MKAFIFLVSILFLINSCRKKPDEQSDAKIGELKIDLNALSEHIRTKEALIGNFICDAVKTQMSKKEIKFDAVFIISGSIRYDANIHPDGIYKKGNITSDIIDEMLPFFENKVVKVKLTGKELKQIMERSVASLPLNKGSFLQLSDNISINVDINQQAQVIDETKNPNIIVQEGNRISDIKMYGTSIDSNKYYEILTVDYITMGNDGYVTFLNIPPERILIYDEFITNLVKDYVIINSIIEPKFSNRINF